MKNNIWKPFAVTLLVIAMLMGLFYMPRIQVGDTLLRRVNILSEVQHRDEEGNIVAEVQADKSEGIVESTFDSTVTKIEKPVFVDSIPEGMTAIEDFSDGATPVMDKFYAALDHASSRLVRVAYYGDSFIEGDILTEDLREYLQQAYGGSGVGFVDIKSITSGFRQTVTNKNSGWNDHNANDGKGKRFVSDFQGINGRYFIPNGTASYELKGSKHKYPAHLDSTDVATVYFTPGSGLHIEAAINGKEMESLFASNGEVQYEESTYTVKDMHVTEHYNEDSTVVTYDTTYTEREVHTSTAVQEQGSVASRSIKQGRLGSFKMTVTGGSASRFYGVALEGNKGVVVDNFSMRASNGWYIKDIPMSTMHSFARMRPYDLIIVHFGLNVASSKQKDYSNYISRMSGAINNLRSAFPNAAILVVSVGDRGEKNADGQMHTMRGIKELISYQRKMASDCHVAFWNLYEGMGGDGSIGQMVRNKQANLDYTHINFAGGKHIAKIFFDVLQNGKENYDKRK
ncbi:MAG: hypothetical protein MJZ36_05200 [Bacteroidaceae bacterium]|nr:hypothetical protein [Bacteroidaceae bacterium]